nr:cell differentiation protein RCD1 homolog [Ipomoea trifida]
MDKINLPETLDVDPTTWELRQTTPTLTIAVDPPEPSPEELVHLLHSSSHREYALSKLAKNRDTCVDLALLLWNSFNIVFVLLQEVMSAYRLLPPSDRRVTARESTRTCNAIALFQCMAAHPLTRMQLIRARIISYLHPFLGITTTTSTTATEDKPLEALRLTSLGVIAALLKIDNPEDGQQIVHYLLESEVFPLFLSCMDHGDEPTQTVSALIIAKILWRAEGLKYCSAYGERFFALVRVLGRVVDRQPAERPSLGLLRSVIACYLRLSEVPRAKDAFRNCIPARMTQHNFIAFIREDPHSVRMLQQLFTNITRRHWTY